MEFMDDFSDYIGTQQLNHDTTETSGTLQKTLYLLVNNEKKLLKLGENTVGRAEDADVRFNLDTVSYNHAVIECEPNDFFVKDLRSTNLTKRDGKVMKPYVVYELKSGTKLMFGNVEATFYAIDDEVTTDQEQVTLPLAVEDDNDQSMLNESVSLLDTSGPEGPEEIILPTVEPKSPSKDHSNVNAKTRVLNESIEGTEESSKGGDLSIHDLETQNPPASKGKQKKDIHDLETQYSPKQDNDEDNVHGLETQCSPPLRFKAKNIHDLETQLSPPPQSSTRRNIHKLETQMSPPPQRSTRKNIHELETQKSPPHNSKRKDMYDLETQVPSNKQNSEEQLGKSKSWDSIMYNMDTQKPVSNNAESETDDEVGGKDTQNEMYSLETQGKQLENEEGKNNAKKKLRKKTKKTQVNSSSSSEEENNSRITRLKTKRKKPLLAKKALVKESMSPKKVSDNSSTDFENLENNVNENAKEPKNNQINKETENKIEEVNDENEKTLENTPTMTNLNDTNSESFIGMVTGKKKRFILSSSSETDIESDSDVTRTNLTNEPETKRTNSGQSSQNNKTKDKPSEQASQSNKDNNEPSNVKNKPTLDTTYKLVAQNNIDELYRSELDVVQSPQTQEQSQFIHEVNTQKPGNTIEPAESQFMMEDNEREEEGGGEMVGSPSLLPPDSPSLLVQDIADNTADVEASSKNTTNYDVSEMDLDSFISGPKTEGRKVINKRTIENSLDNNSSSLFSVSETELRPDFVQEDEEDNETVEQPTKSGKTNTRGKDERKDAKKDTSDLKSTGPKPRKPRGKNKTSEESENSPVQSEKIMKIDRDTRIEETDDSPEHNSKARKKNEGKPCKLNEKDEDNGKKKPAGKVSNKKKNLKKRKEESSSGSSTDSDFEVQVNKKTKHDTIQANQSEEGSTQASGNRKNVVSKVAKSREVGNSVPEYPSNSDNHNDSVDSETDDELFNGRDEDKKSSVDQDFFELPTQKVSVGPSETDDSFVAPTQGVDQDRDFFEMGTQKVSIGPSETDDSFVVSTQDGNKDKDFFEMATQKVSIGPCETDDSFVAPTQANKDFFEMATQQVPSESASTKKEKAKEDFFDMATQKMSVCPISHEEESIVAPTQKKVPNADFFEASTQQVSVNRVSEDFFEVATQRVGVEPCEKSDEGSDEDLFDAPTQKLGDTNPDGTNSGESNKRIDEQQSKKGKARPRNDSESSNFSFDSEFGKKRINVRNNRIRNVKAENEPGIPEEIDNKVPKSKRNQRKVHKITINTKTNVIKENKPESSKETPRKRNLEETTNEVSSDESEITFQPQEKTETHPKRETRLRKKNPKYEDDENTAINGKKKTQESKTLKGKSSQDDSKEKNQPNEQNKDIENVSENIDENESKPQKNKRGRKPAEKKVNHSETKTPRLDEQMDEANVKIEPTTLSRKSRHALAIQHGIVTSPTVSLDRIKTPSNHNKKRNVTETLLESKNSLGTSQPKDIASNERTKTSVPKDKILEEKTNSPSKADSQSETNSQSKKRNQMSSNLGVQDETFTIEESSGVKNTSSKTKTSPDEYTKTATVDTSRRRGRKAKEKPETSTNTEEQEEDISEHLNHEQTTRGGKRVKRGGEKKEEIEEIPRNKGKRGRSKKEDMTSEEIPEKKNAKRGHKKEADNAECSDKKKSEDTEECDESQGTSRGGSGKLSSKRPALKRKDTPVEESPMKPPCAPSTPKKARLVKSEPGSSVQVPPRGGLSDASVRSSPRGRGRQPPDSATGTRGRARSTSSSSDSMASDSTCSSRRSVASVKKTCETKVTFTMVEKPAKYTTLLASLNASIIDDPIISDILVTPKVARSLKFLQFLAMGKPIVTIKWLMDSERCHKFLPHEKYILKDAEAEKTYGFTLAQSIASARRTKLLENYSVFVTTSVKPAPPDMKGIIESSGGTFIPKAPSHWDPYSIIVTDPADSAQLKKLLAISGSKPSVVNKEFILSGILQQKLDFVKHKF